MVYRVKDGLMDRLVYEVVDRIDWTDGLSNGPDGRVERQMYEVRDGMVERKTEKGRRQKLRERAITITGKNL